MNDQAGSPLRLVDDASLSIGDLADRTGVATATLRMWETRYGFPEPHRRRSGHRRYTSTDVELVRRVLDLRASGIRLDAAIDRVTSSHAAGEFEPQPGREAPGRAHQQADRPDDPVEQPTESGAEHTTTRTTTTRTTIHTTHHTDQSAVPVPTSSVFAWLRKRHPEAAPQRLGKRTLRRLSWAVEDEYCSRARPGLIFGAFQRAEFYDAARGRWEQIALLADRSYAFAEFGGEDPQDRDDDAYGGPAPEVVDLPRGHPMSREWCLVADVPGCPAALVAWEIPGQAGLPDAQRRFEAIWSIDPDVVRDAARACASVAAALGSPGAADAVRALAGPAAPSVESVGISSLFNRLLGYADGQAR